MVWWRGRDFLGADLFCLFFSWLEIEKERQTESMTIVFGLQLSGGQQVLSLCYYMYTVFALLFI